MIGIAVSVGVLVMAILSMYFVRYFQAVRILLLAVPFECITWAVLLDSINRWLRGVVLSMMLVCGPGLTYAALRADSADFQIARRDVDFLESIPHDDQTVLVAPRELGLDYLYTHYPVKWSFVPANRETLGLLDQVYPVGTLVLPRDASGDTSLTADDVVSEGFMLVESGQVNGDNYLVFKRTTPAAAIQRLDNPRGP